MKQTAKDTHKHTLVAKKREVFGKKLKKSRADGQLPANIFGPGFTSTSIFVGQKDFSKVFSKAHETGIIYISVNGSDIPVLARQIQRHPLSHDLLHVDFRKVDLSKKIETEVPIKVVGESPAVEQKGGVLLTQANQLLVESLPEDIPQEIEIDISGLDEIGREIKVSDLARGAKFEFKEEPDKVVVSVIAHKEESLEPEVAAPAAEEGVPATEGEAPAEGEAAADGEKAPEEPAKEEKSKPSSAKASEGKEKKEG